MSVSTTQPLHVKIYREPWTTFVQLTLDNGYSEEFDDVDEVRQWFKCRGADMDKVEEALDWVFNFNQCDFFIQTPKDPTPNRTRLQPNI